MRCNVCGRNYHHCTNCDSGGIPWEADGYCSGDCYYDWSQDEIERLTAGLGLSEEYNQQKDAEIERLRADNQHLKTLVSIAASAFESMGLE